MISAARSLVLDLVAEARLRTGGRHKKSQSISRFARDVDATAMARGASNELERLFYGHDGRLIHKWHHYLAIYHRYVGPLRDGLQHADDVKRPLRVLEIGVSQGGSLQLWRRYLGPKAIIFGIDIDPRCAGLDGPDAAVRIGSQADPKFLASVVSEMGGVDVVVEDGSHVASHQKSSFETLFPLLSDGGVYIAEDLHTAYWRRQFEGGYQRPGTFIELCKALVDDMHAWYHHQGSKVLPAHTSIQSISFYDSVVVLEKRKKDMPFHVKVGAPSF
jgi:23S rRNA U2552 (ribose-2'-O)-methylase RlmE/FtsJ